MPYRFGDLVIFTSIDPLFAEVLVPPDGGSPPGGPPPGPPGPIQITINPEIGRNQLRLYLQVALTQLGGPLTAEELRPRSVAEIEALEKHLTGALERLRAQRDRFSS